MTNSDPTPTPRSLTRIVVSMVLLLIGTVAVQAQWTTPDSSQNINNTNSGNVGVGTTTPATKLDVAGVTRAQAFNLNGIVAEKVFSILWNNAVANQKVQIYWPANSQVDGIFEITVTGHYWYSNSNGGIRKRIVINGRNIGVINMQQSEVPFRLGFTGNSNTISNIMWDSTNSRYYFIVANLDNAQNGITIHVKSITPGPVTANADNLNITPIYTTDTTSYPQLFNSFMSGNVGVGTNTPGYRLDVQGGQINSSGGLCIAGDCKTDWSQVGGSGSQWTTSGSTIYYNAGNVGIGTTAAPTRKLEVLGGNVFHQWSTTAGSEYGFYTATNNNHFTSNLYFDGQWKMITTGKGAFISSAPSGGYAFSVVADNTSRAANATASFASLLSVTMGGNVGVGTNSPDSLAKLHLYGSGYFGQDIQTTTNDWTRLRFITPNRTWGFFLDGGSGGIGTGKFGLFDYTANTWRMMFDIAGNVGVGTTSPIYSLDVNGGVNGFRAKAASSSASDTIATFENNSAIQMIVRANGNVGIGTTSPSNKLHVAGSITVDGNINAKYQDVAEWVESSQELPAGTVVILDPEKSNQVIASTQSYDSRVAGVISLQPGIALGEHGEGRVLVASSGRVKVKVDATNGPINIGDLLVTSDKEGFAMKSVPVEFGGIRLHRPGTLIGKALEPLAHATGEILVLLSLQ